MSKYVVLVGPDGHEHLYIDCGLVAKQRTLLEQIVTDRDAGAPKKYGWMESWGFHGFIGSCFLMSVFIFGGYMLSDEVLIVYKWILPALLLLSSAGMIAGLGVFTLAVEMKRAHERTFNESITQRIHDAGRTIFPTGKSFCLKVVNGEPILHIC